MQNIDVFSEVWMANTFIEGLQDRIDNGFGDIKKKQYFCITNY